MPAAKAARKRSTSKPKPARAAGSAAARSRPSARGGATFTTIEIERNGALAIVWLNRPTVRNAMNGTMVAELTRAFDALERDDAVRAVVIGARGEAFCAGADLQWLEKVAGFSAAENLADAEATVAMLAKLAAMTKPTIARVHGAAFAGGLGLVAAADIAVAAHGAEFCVAEVRLGLVPATFAPYVLDAIGPRAALRYFLTAERFDASEAYRIGLVQELAPAEELDGTINALLGHLVQGSPQALGRAKALIRAVAGRPVTAELRALTARTMAEARAAADGREGVRAFLERRRAAWVPAAPKDR
jgi:methylglutaconyl-CoA hydratase